MGKITIRFDELRQRKAEELGKEELTLERIALETELAYGTILRWSKGQITRYDENALIRLLEYFNADIEELLDFEPEVDQ